MKRDMLIPLIMGIGMIVIALVVSSSLPIVVVFIPGVIITFFVYLKTFYRKTPEAGNILPLYLLALGFQFIHFLEEYVTGFCIEVPKLLAQDAYPVDYWVAFNMVAYFLFILGGIILLKRKTEYMMIPLFFIVVGVVLNTVGHLLISLYVGGYFPGLYSALLYVVVGPILVGRIVRETSVI